jgi:hypothetical protein
MVDVATVRRSGARGLQVERVREHSGGGQEVLACPCGVRKLQHKTTHHSCVRR